MRIYIRKDTTIIGECEYVVMVEHEGAVKCLGIKATEGEAIECFNSFKDKVQIPTKEIIKEEVL